MAGPDDKLKGKRRATQPVGDLVGALIDPILSRKAGMTTGLIAAWPEIAGVRLGEVTRPEKLVWPPRRFEDDPFEPALLVVACEGASVLRLQHQASELVGRVNAFFGYPAVARLKIVQRAVVVPRVSHKPVLRPLGDKEIEDVEAMTRRIEDPKLRAALAAYGRSILSRNPMTKT